MRLYKYKTYKSDAAPFFFYIDVIPAETAHFKYENHKELIEGNKFNPIIPLPMRVDRVFNGESSILIKPRDPISFPIEEDKIALINPTKFLKYGLKTLFSYAEIRATEEFLKSVSHKNVLKWWNLTRFLYGKLTTLEEDFSAFLRAYLYTILKAKINNEDLREAAIKYCSLIKKICSERLTEKKILIEIRGKQKIENFYQMKNKTIYPKLKKTQVKNLYPMFIDVEIYDFEECRYSKSIDESSIRDKNSKILSYIPLLFYDDLLECMLQNLKKLENPEVKVIDPTFLLDNGIILLLESDQFNQFDSKIYTWQQGFSELNIAKIIEKINPTFI